MNKNQWPVSIGLRSSRQMRNYLRRKGYKINRKRVQRLMRKMGLQSVAPKPSTSKSHPEHKVYPYLLRGIDVSYANHVKYLL
jgi:putative transposase